MKTLVNIILDKSGSMESVRDATISGFNEYVDTLKRDGNEYDVSLTLFDTTVEIKCTNLPLTEMAPLDKEHYETAGGTALYDAVCQTIKKVKETVSVNQKVLTIIMTDGGENSSKEYTQTQLKTLVEELTKTGMWTFVYLGANQDSWAVAQQFGVQQGNVANFNTTVSGTEAVFMAMATSTSNFASSAFSSSAKFISDEDKDKLQNTL